MAGEQVPDDRGIYAGSVPPTARELIEHLDKHIKPASPRISDLHTEHGRLEMARKIGRREIIDELIRWKDRS